MNVTISLRQGSGNLNHNNRVFITENVDVDRTIENITYYQEDLNIAYNKCFSDAIRTENITISFLKLRGCGGKPQI